MLSDDLDRHAALREALGYYFLPQLRMLKSFVAFAEQHYDHFITVERVLAWATLASSPEQRRTRLLTVRRFATAMHAEDCRHEVPASDAIGRGLYRRKPRYIYSTDEIGRLIAAAESLVPAGSLRPRTYSTIIGLLAATGMRRSEVLALSLASITEDGIIITETKFHKSRMLPLHPTTREALEDYLTARRAVRTSTDSVFIENNGSPVKYEALGRVFKRLVRATGISANPGQPRPRLHDLRHSFAVRSLEQCPLDRAAVSHHVLALSTYLGHTHVTDTYWYLQATPTLMARIADASESLLWGDRS
jgi:integrase